MLARFVGDEEDKGLMLRARAPAVGRKGQTANSVASKNMTMTDESLLLRLCIIAASSFISANTLAILHDSCSPC
jgi:hypothetical protein